MTKPVQTYVPNMCLSMIVKNERHIIQRCIDSVKNIISYWVICDTGSTDGTQAFVKDYFAKLGIPGELHQDQWENFEHNRNLALERSRSKADYILIMDADDYITLDNPLDFMNLTADSYLLKIQRRSVAYLNRKIIKSSKPWYWEGVLHEYLACPVSYYEEELAGNYLLNSTDEGARSHNPEKYKQDALILKKALEKNPYNTRYQFYLGRSYYDAQDYTEAYKAYQQRVTMGGWSEEVYYALLESARCLEALHKESSVVLEAYLKSYYFRPSRLESIYEALRYCRFNQLPNVGAGIAQMVKQISYPEDILFVQKDVYDWRLQDELSLCALHTNNLLFAEQLLIQLVESPLTPAEQLERLTHNLTYCRGLLTS